jgi:tetratricopeptide (TPR) repeat protein
MDPDGTLHNLRPIARLNVSGPDPEPKRNADSEFVGQWFAKKDPPPPAPKTEADGMVLDLDLAGLFNGVALEAAPDEAERRQREAAEGRTEESAQPDPDALRAEVAELMASAEPVAGQDPADREPVEKPAALSAEDLEAMRWRLDGGTLREVVDNKDALRELGERLDGPLFEEVENVAKAGVLSVRAEVYRLLGELGMAAAASRLALSHAEAAQDVQSTVIAQAELGHILRLRKDYREADKLFAKAAAADVPDTLRSVVHENYGRSCFDQGRHMEALDHFARAVRLGRPDDQELAERIGVSLEAVYIHVLRDGWGPYPRHGETPS